MNSVKCRRKVSVNGGCIGFFVRVSLHCAHDAFAPLEFGSSTKGALFVGLAQSSAVLFDVGRTRLASFGGRPIFVQKSFVANVCRELRGLQTWPRKVGKFLYNLDERQNGGKFVSEELL